MKKPILGPCDTYQLEPFEYEWAWTMAREQEQNTWTPEEIQVHGDIADYRNPQIPSHVKHIYTAVLAQLTTFDIERGDDAAETFLQIIQPAELKHFLKRLVWDEALHTRSYRYCIENLGIPIHGPDNIYDQWKHVPVMKARVEMAQHISNELLDHVEGAPHIMRLLTHEARQEFFHAAFFWFLIFEGVWFWLSLSGPVQALARLGMFRQTAEQFQYIFRDEVQHISFGRALLGAFEQQYNVIDEALIQRINQTVERAIELESQYINYILAKGQIIGYNRDDHVETAQAIANMRLNSVGLPRLYPEVSHKFPWMSEQMETKKEKNFFETRVTEYQVGGSLTWDD